MRYSAEIWPFWQQQRIPGKVPDPVNGGDYLLEGEELEMGLLQDGAAQLQLTVQPARVVGPAANQSNDDIETIAKYATT